MIGVIQSAALIAASIVGPVHSPAIFAGLPVFLIAPAVGAALISLAPWVFNLLFGGGGGDDQTQTTTSETTPSKYRSPALGLMEPGILSALLGNAQAMGGAGMPGGKSRFGGNADTMFQDVISMLMKEWPTVKDEYNNPKETCQQCQQYSQNGPNANANYYSQCMAKCQASKA